VAVSVLDIQVNSQGAVRNLRDVSASSKAAQSGVDGLSSASKGAERSVGGLNNAIGNLLKVYAGVQAIKFVFVSAAEIETQTKSIAVLTGSVDRAKQIISELQALGAVTPFTSTELIDAAKRLNAFGVEAEKVVETTRRLADVSGATGAELQGLVTAYGQVQAKGRLQGEELLQFQERGIALQDELRKMYGMTGDEFQKALGKGRISAEAVEVAIIRLTDKGGKYANGAIAQSDTLNGKLSTLQDSFQRLAANIGTFFAPAFKFLISKTDELINRLNRGAFGVQAEMQQRAGAERLSRAGVTERTYKDAQGNVYSTITGRLVQAAKPRTQAAKPIPGLLGGTAPSGGGSTSKASTSAAENAAKAAAKEAERVGQVIRDRLAEGELLRVKSGLQDKIAAAEASGDRMLAARLQGQQKEIDIQYQYAQALAQEKNVRAQEAIIFEGNTRLVANQRDTQRELASIQRQNEQEGLQSITAYLEKQYELNAAIQQQKSLAESISSTLGQGMTSAFTALISGADNWAASLQQIASKVLVDIANQLIQIFVIEQAINSIKSFLSPFSSSTPLGAGGGMIGKFGTFGPNYGIAQRALGGPVSAGSPYLVGERGPELFMPSRGGSIIPNNALGGGGTSVVVNVDASGSSVQGDQAQSRQLGIAISSAVQAELVKQKRPGGLLA
jgi:tape measure domain-containing protein